MLLGVMRTAILLLPFRKIIALMGLVQGEQPGASESIAACRLAAIAWAVQAAALRTPWESACLVQALTGMAMLARRGGSATLSLGVGRNDNVREIISAHAWLQCGGKFITGAGGYEKYSIISSFSRR